MIASQGRPQLACSTHGSSFPSVTFPVPVFHQQPSWSTRRRPSPPPHSLLPPHLPHSLLPCPPLSLAPPPPNCTHVSATARLDAAASPDGAVRRCKNCSIHSRLLPRWGQGGAKETTACSSSTKAGERVRERGARFHKGGVEGTAGQ